MLRLLSTVRVRLIVLILLAALLGAGLTLAVLRPVVVNWLALLAGLLVAAGVVGLAAEMWVVRPAKALYFTPALARILDVLPLGIFWKDRQSVYQGCNAAFARTVGLPSPEAIVGKTDLDLPWSKSEAEAYRAADLNVLQTGQPVWHFVDHLQKADGSRDWVETNKIPLWDEQGQVTGVVGVDIDITDRVQAEKIRAEAEAALARNYRALRAIGECNHAVIRALDETELFRTVCSLLTDIGGYRMAWVGLAEQDEAKTVRAVALAGFEEGYLEQAGVTWADVERGRGPTGTAIRTGQTVAGWDIQNDPRMQPWRDEAAKRGYVASLALPLQTEAGILGALTIYAAEADAFDREEVNLLEGLAGNLAHGVRLLRLRAERDRVQAALQEKTQELDQFFTVALELLAIANTDGYFLRLNPMWEKTLGYSEAELRSHQFLDFVHPDDIAATRAAMRALSEQKQVWHFENRYRCHDGSYRWIEWNSFSIGERIYAAARDVTERRQAEAALRLSEDKFSKAFHTSPDSININRLADGVYIDINEGFTRMTGYTREDVLGRSSLPGDLSFWANAEDRTRLVAGLRAKGEVVGLEAPFRLKDGTTIIGLMSARLIEVNGETCLLNITRDITERKRMEEALRDSEARYRLVAENVRDVIWTMDNDYRFTYISPSIRLLRGLEPQEAMRETVEATMTPESFEQVRQSIVARRAAEARGETDFSQRLEVQQKRKDGSLVWVEILTQPLTDSNGRRIGFVGISRDIGERKQAELALRASEEKFRTIVEQFSEGLIVVDEQGFIIEWNHAIEAILGLPRSAVIDRPAWEVQELATLPERQISEHAEHYKAALLNYLRTGQAPFLGVPAEVPVRNAAGQLRYTRQVAFPIRTDKGWRLGTVLWDITERKQAEMLIQAQKEQLEAQNEELQAQNEELLAQGQALSQVEVDLRQLNMDLEQRVADRTQELSLANAALVRAARMKDEFLASMSHELRTPLTGILGLSEALQMGIYGPLAERQRATVDTVYESGQHLLDLINDILDVSKIEAGKAELQLAPVPVAEVCQSSLQFVRQMAQKKNLQLTTNQDFAVGVVRADGRRLKQMLVNLLSNAVKFTPEGGAVGLEVVGDMARHEVRFTVWDTGIGIAREDLPRLFKPFVQLDSRLSRQYAGTGLGLSLVMGLAELHGGRVEVESELGKGSRFTILLPWSGESPQALVRRSEKLSGQRLPLSRVRRALLIEDSPVVADQLKLYLADLGIENAIHPMGQDAVEAALALTPDVILLDILLPDISGWEVLEALKADRRTQTVPVIVVSVVDERQRAQALGAAGYLVKPVSLADLQLALSRGVEQARPPRPPVLPAEAADQGSAGGPVILLADDSDIVVSAVGDFLRAQSFQLAVAQNGGQAIDMARAIRPALILMDIQMPGIDGLTAIRRLRADPDEQLAATPIIALTALAMSGDRERCLAAGANDYVPKPVNLELLVKTVTAHLSTPPGHSAAS